MALAETQTTNPLIIPLLTLRSTPAPVPSLTYPNPKQMKVVGQFQRVCQTQPAMPWGSILRALIPSGDSNLLINARDRPAVGSLHRGDLLAIARSTQSNTLTSGGSLLAITRNTQSNTPTSGGSISAITRPTQSNALASGGRLLAIARSTQSSAPTAEGRFYQ